MSRVLQRTVERIPEDPVGFWLGRLDPVSHPSMRSILGRWMKWLHTQPRWESVTEQDLLIKQLTGEDDYEILDLLQKYVSSLPYRKKTK